MNRSLQSVGVRDATGALFMDVNSAFNNVSKMHLGRRLEALKLEADLIRWTGSPLSNRQVKLVRTDRWGRQIG